MKHRLSIFLLTGAFLGLSSVAGAQTLSLEECRAAALEHNRTLASSRLELEASRQMRREALTNYFPKIAAKGGVFQAQNGLVQADISVPLNLPPSLPLPQLPPLEVPLSFMKRGFVVNVTAVQPVFAGLKIVNGNKLARLGEEVGELQVRKSEGEVREKTDTYFWQIVALKDNLSTLQAVDRQLDEIHRLVELSVRAGLVTKNDLLRVELRRQEIASARLKLENGIRLSKMLLAQHIGMKWEGFDIGHADFDHPSDPASCYVDMDEALDRRAEYQMAQKNVEAQKYRKRMERGKMLPTVGIGAGYQYYNLTEKPLNTGMVFAEVSVPISDWWGGSHSLKRARIAEQQAENRRLEAEEMIMIEIEKSWNDLQEAYAQIQIARRSVSSSEENLRQHRNFYGAGTASMTDLLDAETLYTRSRHELTAALSSYYAAQAAYMRATGR